MSSTTAGQLHQLWQSYLLTTHSNIPTEKAAYKTETNGSSAAMRAPPRARARHWPRLPSQARHREGGKRALAGSACSPRHGVPFSAATRKAPVARAARRRGEGAARQTLRSPQQASQRGEALSGSRGTGAVRLQATLPLGRQAQVPPPLGNGGDSAPPHCQLAE